MRNQTALVPHSAPDDVVDVRDLGRTVIRNWYLPLIGVVLGGMIAMVVTARMSPLYSGTATLLVGDRPTPAPKLTGGPVASPEGNINTEMQFLQSRMLAEEVVDSLGLQLVAVAPKRVSRSDLVTNVKVSADATPAIYRFELQPNGEFAVADTTSGAKVAKVKIGEPLSLGGAKLTLIARAKEHPVFLLGVLQRDDAIGSLLGGLSIDRPNRLANTLSIGFQTPDRELARDVPNVLATHYIVRRNEVMKSGDRETATYLNDQTTAVGVQLRTAEDKLRRFREQQQLVSPDIQANSEVTRALELQAKRNDMESERVAIDDMLKQFDAGALNDSSHSSAARRLLGFPTLLKSAPTVSMLNELANAEAERSELLTRRTPSDPDVQALTKRVNDIESQIRSVLVSYRDGLASQVAGVDTTLRGSSRVLAGIPGKEAEYVRLERDTKVLSEIYTTLQARLKEAEIGRSLADASVQVLDRALLPKFPSSPKPMLNLAAGLFLGLAAGLAFAFGRDMMDSAVHTRRDVQDATGAPVLGLIPHVSALSRGSDGRLRLRAPKRSQMVRAFGNRLVVGRDPRGAVSEAYRSLRTNLTFSSSERVPKTLVFTSPAPGEGKTTSVANLAVALAQQGSRVLVIDADMRRGVLNRIFNTRRDPGLADVLAGRVDRRRAIRRIDLGDTGMVDLLATGVLPHNPADLLASPALTALLAEVVEEYDVILIDTPPLNLFTDAAVLATHADGVLLVARAGKTPAGALSYAAEQLRSVRVPVLGALLNDFDAARDSRGAGKYDYYGTQAYQYTPRESA